MEFDTLLTADLNGNSVERYLAGERVHEVFIVKDTRKNKYLLYGSLAEFIKYRETTKGLFYEDEVILGIRKQKLKFDIDIPSSKLANFTDVVDSDMHVVGALDMPEKNKKILGEIIDLIDEQFYIHYNKILTAENFVIIVSDDPKDEKFSVHIIINDYYVESYNEAQHFTDIIAENIRTQIKDFIDWGVNKRNQNMRLPMSCKPDAPHRVARIVTKGHTLSDAVISVVSGEPLRPLAAARLEEPVLVQDVNGAIFEKILDIAQHHADENKSRFRCHKNGMIVYDRYESAHCHICDRHHDKDNTFYVTFHRTNEGNIKIQKRCRRNRGAAIEIGCIQQIECQALHDVPREDDTNDSIEDAAVNKWSNNRILDTISGNQISCLDSVESFCADTHIYDEPKMRSYELCETLVVQAQMKIGKTNGLKEIISKHFPSSDITGESRIVFVSFRQTFAANIKDRFPEFTLYSDVVGPLTHSKLIIQVESLMRIPMHVGQEPPDLFILDECESIFEQFGSGLHRNQHANFNIFKWMLANAKHVICMDANITLRTIRLLDRMRGKPIRLHKNLYKVAKDDHYYFMRDAGAWLHMLDCCVKNGERVVIPMNINRRAEALFEFLQNRYNGHFMDDTYGTKQTFPAKTVAIYNSKTLPSVKKAHFSDVNQTWAKYDILIYTPTVTAGVSFEKAHYDRMFGWFSDQSCAAETCMQMMGRIRNVKNKQYFIYVDFRHMFFPITIEDIRHAVDKNRYALVSNEANMFSFEYNSECNIVRHNSDYFWMWVENERIKNISKNTFLRRLVAIIQNAGANVHHYSDCYKAVTGCDLESGTSRAICGLLLGCVNVMKESQQVREIRAIAKADEIGVDDFKEIESLKSQQLDITLDQRYSYKKYKLRQDYVDFSGIITEQFVKTYLPFKVRQIYANLRQIRVFPDFQTAYTALREYSKMHYVTAMETNPIESNAQMLDITIRHRFHVHKCALRCLMLMGFNSLYDRHIAVNEMIMIVRPHLQKIYDCVRDDIQSNGGNVERVCTSDPISHPMSFLTELCKIVNPCVRRTYDAEVIINKDLGNCFIKRSNLFDETGQPNPNKPTL